jgi:hypothetical protein
MKIDVKRRFFLFGAAATLAIPERTLHFLPKVPFLVPRPTIDITLSIEMILGMRDLLDAQDAISGIAPHLRWTYLSDGEFSKLVRANPLAPVEERIIIQRPGPAGVLNRPDKRQVT